MGDADVAAVAALLGDRARAAMCVALLDGRALTAGELARVSGVAAPTASGHLRRLVDGGVLTVVAQGRHRYHRLAGPLVADAVEALARLAPPLPVRSLRQSAAARALAAGRTCYDHLAGRLGLALLDGLVEAGAISRVDGGLAVGLRVADVSAAFGVDLDAVRAERRPMVRSCLDWTERRDHLAGGLAAALLRHSLGRGWVVRIGTGRAVALTPAGERAFAESLPAFIA